MAQPLKVFVTKSEVLTLTSGTYGTNSYKMSFDYHVHGTVCMYLHIHTYTQRKKHKKYFNCLDFCFYYFSKYHYILSGFPH